MINIIEILIKIQILYVEMATILSPQKCTNGCWYVTASRGTSKVSLWSEFVWFLLSRHVQPVASHAISWSIHVQLVTVTRANAMLWYTWQY